MNNIKTEPLILDTDFNKQLNTGAWLCSQIYKRKGYIAGGSSGSVLSSILRLVYETDTTTIQSNSMVTGRFGISGVNNLTDGWFNGGLLNGYIMYSNVDRTTFASDTNMTVLRSAGCYSSVAAGNSGKIAGYFGGGEYHGSYVIGNFSKLIYANDTMAVSGISALVLARDLITGTSDLNNYGWWASGYDWSGIYHSTVDRLTYATDTNAATLRCYLNANKMGMASVGNTVAGWFSGGQTTGGSNASMVERLTYATDTTTPLVRGPTTTVLYVHCATGNATDGWFQGGQGYSSINRITYATDTVTAAVRGNISSYAAQAAGI